MAPQEVMWFSADFRNQGTYWTNSSDPDKDWVSIRGADGAYVAVEDGGGAYYISTQYAKYPKDDSR